MRETALYGETENYPNADYLPKQGKLRYQSPT